MVANGKDVIKPAVQPNCCGGGEKLYAQFARATSGLCGRAVGKHYLMGNGFTVADAYLFVVLNLSGRVGVDLGPYPKIKEYMARVATRPAVQAAMKAEGLIQ
jgi:glutathione S-transferase